MIRTLSKPRIEGNFVNMIESFYEKPTANIILNSERLKAFPFRAETIQRHLLSSLLFNITLEVLARPIWQGKKSVIIWQ